MAWLDLRNRKGIILDKNTVYVAQPSINFRELENDISLNKIKKYEELCSRVDCTNRHWGEMISIEKAVSAKEIAGLFYLSEYTSITQGHRGNFNIFGITGFAEDTGSSPYRVVVDMNLCVSNITGKNEIGWNVTGDNIENYLNRIDDFVGKNIVVPVANRFGVQFFYFENDKSLNDMMCWVECRERFLDYLYPCVDAKSLFGGYLLNKAPILLMTGQPGTGKSVLTKLVVSNFVSERIKHNNIKVGTVGVEPMMIGHSNGQIFYVKDKEVMSDDRFWLRILSNTPSVIIFDDLDFGLTSRKDGNSFMDKLISFSDGFLSIQNTKIIITSNFHDVSLDEALMRPGRLYDYIELKALNSEQIVNVLKEQKIIEKDFYYNFEELNGKKMGGNLTLAEIFEVINYMNDISCDGELGRYRKFKSGDNVCANKGIGFNNSK